MQAVHAAVGWACLSSRGAAPDIPRKYSGTFVLLLFFAFRSTLLSVPVPTNSFPPYLHWHAACAGCNRLIFVQAGPVPGPLNPPDNSPVATCPHCSRTQAYPKATLVLHSGQGTLFGPDHSKPPVAVAAVIAGMVAAVRLARIDGAEISRGTPKVRAIISDAIGIARSILAEMGRSGSAR